MPILMTNAAVSINAMPVIKQAIAVSIETTAIFLKLFIVRVFRLVMIIYILAVIATLTATVNVYGFIFGKVM
jgi:hypothetical protein